MVEGFRVGLKGRSRFFKFINEIKGFERQTDVIKALH